MLPINRPKTDIFSKAPLLVSKTVALMEELISLMKREIDIVAKRKMKEHSELLRQKQKLAMDYRTNMKAIADHPNLLKTLTEEAKNALREVSRRLASVVDENARVLRAAADATRQLVQNVVAMVRSEIQQNQGYKNSAKAHMELGNYSPTCRPVAVSRTV